MRDYANKKRYTALITTRLSICVSTYSAQCPTPLPFGSNSADAIGTRVEYATALHRPDATIAPYQRTAALPTYDAASREPAHAANN